MLFLFEVVGGLESVDFLVDEFVLGFGLRVLGVRILWTLGSLPRVRFSQVYNSFGNLEFTVVGPILECDSWLLRCDLHLGFLACVPALVWLLALAGVSSAGA